jgi:hypothetical protein
MANIWPVYEGKTPTLGWPWASLPLSEAIALFELRPDDFVSDLETTPRFGAVDRDLTFAGFKRVVVEVETSEGRHANWKPGFYRTRIKPKEAFTILIRQALATELGQDNVLCALGAYDRLSGSRRSQDYRRNRAWCSQEVHGCSRSRRIGQLAATAAGDAGGAYTDH